MDVEKTSISGIGSNSMVNKAQEIRHPIIFTEVLKLDKEQLEEAISVLEQKLCQMKVRSAYFETDSDTGKEKYKSEVQRLRESLR